MAWAIVIAAHVGVAAIIWLTRDADALKWIGLALVVEAGLVYTLYFCGATAQHLVEIAGRIAPSVSVGLAGISVGPAPNAPPPTKVAPE